MKDTKKDETDSTAKFLILLFACGIVPMLGLFIIISAAQSANLPTAIFGILAMMTIAILVYRTTERSDYNDSQI